MFTSRFMRLFGLTAFAIFLASACSKQPDPISTSAPKQTNAGPAKQRVVNLLSWDEYFHEEVVFRNFEAQTGIKIVYHKYNSSDEMLQALKSNPEAYDVIVTDDSPMKNALELRLFRALDHSKVPNVRENNDSKWLDNESYDPGNRYSAPYMWGTTLIAYRNDKIEDPIKSWKIFFDPQYAGKVSVLDERIECYSAALRALGHEANTEDHDQLQEATDSLVWLASQNKVKMGSDNDMKDHLRDARSWIAMMYSGDAALIADEANEAGTGNISFFIPEEGAPIWIDSFFISRDSQNLEEAHAFINYMADPKVAAESSNFLWYATPNIKAEPYLNADLRSDDTIYPSQSVLTECDLLREGSPSRIRTTHSGWGKVHNARTDIRADAISTVDGPDAEPGSE